MGDELLYTHFYVCAFLGNICMITLDNPVYYPSDLLCSAGNGMCSVLTARMDQV
jgi:hypothetical protein